MTVTDLDTTPPAGPYAAAAAAYRRAGWSPLPLPHGQKKSPPNGWTGREGAWPSGADVQAWTEDHGGGNIALRMPPNVLGIDVDDYKDKPGAAVLDALQERHGTLPPTWTSSSRGGRSGIRFYRVPEGLRWPGILGPGIETIRFDHRYAVAWPSLHPEGGTYRWTRPDGATALNEGTMDLPTVDDLPPLPDTWITALTHGEAATDQPRANLTDDAASAWFWERSGGQPCRVMQKVVDRGRTELTTGTSRHDAGLALTNRIIWLAGEGHQGGTVALLEARRAFNAATAERREPGEWERMVSGAVRLSAAAHPTALPDPCDDPFSGLIPKENPSASLIASMMPPQPSRPEGEAGGQETPSPDSSNADDAYELDLRRQQAAQQALEQMRAQRAAARLLEAEDEEATIADRVRRKVLDDKALLAYKALTDPPAPPFDAGTLRELLARPADPPMRMSGLIPWESSTLIVAKRKTGKTTLILNYVRAMLTGTPFLGVYETQPVQPDACVALLNYEVSAAMIARWAAEVGIDHDRFYVVNLRGRRNPLSHPDDRAILAEDLLARNVESIICDPFGRAYTGKSQNDSGEVGAWLVDLDLFTRSEAGAKDLILAAHAGWDGERTRGASALEDWADVIVTLTNDSDDESQRYLKALGRDVEVDEDRLNFDPRTRTLSMSGAGSRKRSKDTRKVSDLSVFVVRLATERPGISFNQLESEIRKYDDAPTFQKGDGGKAAQFARTQGLLRIDAGGVGRPTRCFPVLTPPQPPQTSPDLPGGEVLQPPHLPSKGEVGGGGTGGPRKRPHGTLVDGELIDLETGEILTRERTP